MHTMIMLRLAVILVLSGVAQGLMAASYKVEVLIFAQKLANSEVFNQTASSLKPPAQTIEVTAINDPTQISLSEEPLSGLNAAYQQMLQQSTYEMLVKKAWIQEISPNQTTPAVHLEKLGSLNGYVTLMTNGAMTMQVDIEYSSAKENHYSELMGANPLVYRLSEKRPLKFNESHYFDHPAVGVILLVTPL